MTLSCRVGILSGETPSGGASSRVSIMLSVVSMTSTTLNTTPLLVGEATGVVLLVSRGGLDRPSALSVLAMDQFLVGLAKVAVLCPDNEYGIEMGKQLKVELAKRKDLTVTSFIDYGASAQDLLQPVLKVKASQPDVVVQVGYFRAGVLASKAYEQLDFHPVVIGTGGMSGALPGANCTARTETSRASLAPETAAIKSPPFFVLASTDHPCKVVASMEKCLLS